MSTKFEYLQKKVAKEYEQFKDSPHDAITYGYLSISYHQMKVKELEMQCKPNVDVKPKPKVDAKPKPKADLNPKLSTPATTEKRPELTLEKAKKFRSAKRYEKLTTVKDQRRVAAKLRGVSIKGLGMWTPYMCHKYVVEGKEPTSDEIQSITKLNE
jgi:hypothetical protein